MSKKKLISRRKTARKSKVDAAPGKNKGKARLTAAKPYRQRTGPITLPADLNGIQIETIVTGVK